MVDPSISNKDDSTNLNGIVYTRGYDKGKSVCGLKVVNPRKHGVISSFSANHLLWMRVIDLLQRILNLDMDNLVHVHT